MSRCFPFPPPGYIRNNSDALIDSIKLREKEKAKKDRKEKKEKKREKKERKKEKKERKLEEKLKLTGKLQKVENIDNERSGITEELEQPVTSQEPCCLSDSSQSSKRKRESSRDHGTGIKIRLPLRKRESEEPKSEHQLGSSSAARFGKADSCTQDACASNQQLQPSCNMETNQLPGNSNSEHCKTVQNLAPDSTPATNEIIDDESRRVTSLYNSLLQIPPLSGYVGFNSADEDWLFRSDLTEAKSVSKKLKYDSEAAFQSCSKSLWPRAQYLPEVEIYALPYAVPF